MMRNRKQELNHPSEMNRRAHAEMPFIEPLENRCLLSAAAAPLQLAGTTFAGNLYLGHLFANFAQSGASTTGQSHVRAMTVSIESENANGLIVGTANVQNLGTFNLTGTAMGNRLDAVITSTTAGTGQINGGLVNGTMRMNGSFVDQSGKQTERGAFQLNRNTSVAGATGTSGAVATTAPPTASNSTDKIAAGSYVGATGNRHGISIDVTNETADGLIEGVVVLQNVGTFNFQGVTNGRTFTLFVDGADGSGTISGTVGTNSFRLAGNLNTQQGSSSVKTHFKAVNAAVPAPKRATSGANGAGVSLGSGNTNFPPTLDNGAGGVTNNGGMTITPPPSAGTGTNTGTAGSGTLTNIGSNNGAPITGSGIGSAGSGTTGSGNDLNGGLSNIGGVGSTTTSGSTIGSVGSTGGTTSTGGTGMAAPINSTI
jgi:hypothetical protein